MTKGRYFWYWDEDSAASAGQNTNVLLVGGFFGYMNFGDIAQLKGAISLHRRHTGLAPIIVCHAHAVRGRFMIEQLRQWFGVKTVLFGSSHPADFTDLGLHEASNPVPVPYLHVYGGGFLNHRWGPAHLLAIESLYSLFGVRHYQMSGQQVSPSFEGALKQHFKNCPPRLAAGRDPASTELLKRCGVKSAYSFDDSAEFLLYLANALRTKQDLTPEDELIIHLNASSYVGNSGPEELIDRLCGLLNTGCDDVAPGSPQPRVTVFHAYEDQRPDVLDSLDVIARMGSRFPFSEFRVSNLARLALESERISHTLHRPFHAGTRAITTSYHVALLCGFAQVPCDFHVFSDYYRQKKAGIYTANTDFTTLDSSRQGRLAARARWLDLFVDSYRDVRDRTSNTMNH